MILGVFSDTHGNRKFLERARKLAVDHFGASALIHLGDNYSDAEELMLEFSPVWAVPGLWCAAYHNPSIPRTRIEGAGNLLVHFAHAEQDLEPERRTGADYSDRPYPPLPSRLAGWKNLDESRPP